MNRVAICNIFVGVILQTDVKMGALQVWCCRRLAERHFSKPGQREPLLSIHRWRWEPCRCGAADRCQSSSSQHLGSRSHCCLTIYGDGSLAGVVLQTGVKAALLNTWAAGVVAALLWGPEAKSCGRALWAYRRALTRLNCG